MTSASAHADLRRRADYRRLSLPMHPLILCYHAVSADWPSSLAMPPDTFGRQLRRLAGKGYVGLTLSQAEERMAAGTLPKRTVVVTFDDAYTSTLLAKPILAEHGYPATVFAVTDFAGRAAGGCPGPGSTSGSTARTGTSSSRSTGTGSPRWPGTGGRSARTPSPTPRSPTSTTRRWSASSRRLDRRSRTASARATRLPIPMAAPTIASRPRPPAPATAWASRSPRRTTATSRCCGRVPASTRRTAGASG